MFWRHHLMKIPVNGITGYDRRNENLIITLMENEKEVANPEMEIEEGPLILQFASPEVLSTAFAAITKFERETVILSTPPSDFVTATQSSWFGIVVQFTIFR